MELLAPPAPDDGRSRGEKVADGTVDAWCELDGARLDADVALGVEVEHD